MAKALLSPEELAGQNAELHLYMLRESAEPKLNVDMSYLHGFQPAKRDCLAFISRQPNPETGNRTLIGGGRPPQVIWPKHKQEGGN